MLRINNIRILFSLSLILVSNSKFINESTNSIRKFPDGFLFGTATAAYQIEGAWDADGKSESIWDHSTHANPCRVKDCSNGDVADNSYYLYKRDVEMMRELGLDFYRFSVSWTRILPTSFPDKINEAGVKYYNNLIDEMLKYNIQPMITIYHWDLPQKLQELGGWTNPRIVDWFTDFSRVVFERFGDRVKNWITINEPREICLHAVGLNGVAEYLCSRNILVAHATVYHMYNKEYRPKYGGTVGITLSANWMEPESEKYILAANEAMLFEWGQYVHPIFTSAGDYPQVMKEKIGAKSATQGFFRSRLPEFTQNEIDIIRGSSDFLGINHYTSDIIYRNKTVQGYYDEPSYFDDMNVIAYKSSNWTGATSSWLKSVPWGFYKLLTAIRENYNNPTVIITENGFSTVGGLVDDDRITYYRLYLEAMLDAIEEGSDVVFCRRPGSDVVAYSAWSLMDNFEWTSGYTECFGLYEVDYTSPERTRTPRKSAFVYKQILRERALDHHYQPDTTVMTIDEGH